MAAPSYTTDLVLLADAESYATDNSGVGGTWAIFGGTGGSSPGIGEDFAIEGQFAIDLKITSNNGRRGPVFEMNTARSLGTDEMFFVWCFVATPGILTAGALPAGTAATGLCVFAGNNITNSYVHYRVKDPFDYGERGRVGECFAWIPDGLSAINESIEIAGTPSAPWNIIGATASFSANSKGNNFATDAIRQGTGMYITDGETANPGTLSGLNSSLNASANAIGTIVKLFGTAYEVQGVLAIGVDNTGTSETATCIFTDDSGASIGFREIAGNTSSNPNTKNKFIVGGSATTATFASASFTQLQFATASPYSSAGASKGSAEVELKDSSLSTFRSCTFTYMSNWTLTSTNTSNKFTNCNFNFLYAYDLGTGVHSVVDANNGNFEFSGCTFSGNTQAIFSTSAGEALLAAPLDQISNCTFENLCTAGNSGHAVNAGTVSASTTYTWNSTAVTGAATDASTFRNANGSTGHEVIRINYTDTSAPLTIEYTNGATIPTVYNTGAGTVNVVAQQINFELTSIKDATEIRIINASTNVEIAGVEDVTGGVGTTINNGSGAITVSGSTDNNTVNYAYTYSSDINIKIAIVNRDDYEILYIQSTLTSANQSTQIFQREERNFSDPPP